MNEIAPHSPGRSGRSVPIILDTDLDTDCDDAGALAVLHHLADAGRARILGVVCDAPAPHAGAAAAALNAHFGRPKLPVAQCDPSRAAPLVDYLAHRSRCRPEQLYGDFLGKAFAEKNPFVPEDPVALYRRLLAREEDGGVTICAIGLLGPLAALLESPPDAHSPLSGRELVSRKVRCLVSMAIAETPRGRDRFNWWMDRPSADRVLHRWPTPIFIQPHGEQIPTGADFQTTLPAEDPLRIAFERFLGGGGRSRPSWDQLTVLWAALGEASGLRVDFEGGLRYHAETGEHEWLEAPIAAPRMHLGLRDSPRALTRLVESYMLGVSVT
ncbi:MAG: nucleoside hydrolase [Spirochaetes bacterium]|nr:nucleoside hydrolase [Spirochaetota bacterium]